MTQIKIRSDWWERGELVSSGYLCVMYNVPFSLSLSVRCMTRKQNREYVMYLLKVLYLESIVSKWSATCMYACCVGLYNHTHTHTHTQSSSQRTEPWELEENESTS